MSSKTAAIAVLLARLKAWDVVKAGKYNIINNIYDAGQSLASEMLRISEMILLIFI